jgi:hypothetical protein
MFKKLLIAVLVVTTLLLPTLAMGQEITYTFNSDSEKQDYLEDLMPPVIRPPIMERPEGCPTEFDEYE